MNRSSYTEDYINEWRATLRRGAVASAIRGKRGIAADSVGQLRAIADSTLRITGLDMMSRSLMGK